LAWLGGQSSETRTARPPRPLSKAPHGQEFGPSAMFFSIPETRLRDRGGFGFIGPLRQAPGLEFARGPRHRNNSALAHAAGPIRAKAMSRVHLEILCPISKDVPVCLIQKDGEPTA
jgi:hypothetical protein